MGAEHHAHGTLYGDSSIAHVLVVIATELPSNKLLDGAASLVKFLGVHASNADKGLATENELRATALETNE